MSHSLACARKLLAYLYCSCSCPVANSDDATPKSCHLNAECPLSIGCILSNSIINWVQEAKEIKSIGSVVCCSSCQLLFLIVIGWVVVLFHVGAYCSRFSPLCRSGTFILCTGTYSLVGRVLVLVLDKEVHDNYT